MLPHTITGNKNLPPLVFLHGLLGSKEDWEEVIFPLTRRFCCYCLDLPGHMAAPIAENPLAAIVETLDGIGIEKTTIVGYSMGGRLALQLGRKYPERFPHQIVLSAHLGLDNENAKRERWALDQKWVELLAKEPMDVFLEKWYQQPLFTSFRNNTPAFEKAIERRLSHDPKKLSYILSVASLAKQEMITDLSRSYFLVGDLDIKFWSPYEKIIPASHFTIIPGVGHVAHLENPIACSEAIFSHLKVLHDVANRA